MPDSSLELEGAVVLVTGSSRGIGAACVEGFARRGARTVVHYRTNEAAAAAVAERIEAAGGRTPLVMGADLERPEACEHLVHEVERICGRLDVLVHNAAIQRPARVVDTSLEDWRAVMAVNLDAAFALSKAVLPGMRRRGSGSIVHVSSASAYLAHPGLASYVASKQGLIGLTKALAVESARHGIRVNAVAPGMTDTDMIAAVGEAQRSALAASIPMKRMATPDEIARLVVWVASEATYATGNVFHASGGVVMH